MTGYIGGDFLHLAVTSHPEWQFSCLVRDSAKAAQLTRHYSEIRIVIGDLDSVDLLEEEAATADIVYTFANCDHVPSARAIAKGAGRNKNGSVHWIHTSGAGILTHENFALNSFGALLPSQKLYDDWDGINDLTSLPDKALHRHVDKIILSASSGREEQVMTAIVCPPAIYGVGRGTGNTRSVQVYMAANLSLKSGVALQVGNGSTIWHGIHIHDLSQLYLLLGEAAITRVPKATWNRTGYYLAENGSFEWGEVARSIAKEGKRLGLLDTDEVKCLTTEEAKSYNQVFPYLCGTTSRGQSKRAGILLGWKPVGNSLADELPRIVREEARSLGLMEKRSGEGIRNAVHVTGFADSVRSKGKI